MEKDIKLGSVGDLDLKVEGGIASATVNASISLFNGAFSFALPLKVSADLNSFIKAGFAVIESKSPSAIVPAEQMAEGLVEQAVDKI